MLISLALIFLVGLAMAGICEKVKIPRIVGMLITGVVLGPFVLDFLDPTILGISADLRKIALIIILIKAGLSLNISDLKKVGRPAVFMAFLPSLFEISAFVVFAPMLLKISVTEALILGSVMGAVSPAVVVPRMVHLMENKYGTEKGIPQMILAGASIDDVLDIVLFSTFVTIEQGNSVSLIKFADIPVSIVSGVALGATSGFLLAFFFETLFKHKSMVRNSTKVIVVLGVSFLLMAVETVLEGKLAFSGLLAVVSMACVLQIRSKENVIKRLSEKFGKLWIASEVILFVLVGSAVDIRYTLDAGLPALAMIFTGLIFRSVAVMLSLVKTNINMKERLFCVIAYLPKATVQAAIGSVPLSLGLPCGKIVLSVAVLGIIITAPMGAFGMELTYKRLLKKD